MSYTIKDVGNCRLVFGSIPLTELSGLINRMPADAVSNAHVARLAQASLAFGAPADLEALAQDPSLRAAALERARSSAPYLSENALQWLAFGQQGASSMSLFQHLTGLHLSKRKDHPQDPADFSRCRLLLEQVPELVSRLGEAASISPVWASLVSRWDDLCSLMDREAPNWRAGAGSARKTHELMMQLGC